MKMLVNCPSGTCNQEDSKKENLQTADKKDRTSSGSKKLKLFFFVIGIILLIYFAYSFFKLEKEIESIQGKQLKVEAIEGEESSM
jgi:hypothetical protein